MALPSGLPAGFPVPGLAGCANMSAQDKCEAGQKIGKDPRCP